MESKITPIDIETQPSPSPVERLLETKSSKEVVGEIMLANGVIKSYLPGNGDTEWAPGVHDARGRKMIVFSEHGHIMGPRLGLETLRPFIETPLETKSSKSHGSPQVNMLPYARFEEGGDFAPEKSAVFLLSTKQCDDLRQLLNEKK